MKEYIGTKKLLARPISRGEYNEYRGWKIPATEDPSERGYLVEYLDGGKANDHRHAGYITWSPKDVFDKAYRPTDGMNFGMALEAAQLGDAITRPGLGLNVAFMSSMTLPPYNTQGTDRKVNDRTATFIGKDTPFLSKPYLAAYKKNGEWQPGWTPSFEDLFAVDWFIANKNGG